MTLVLDYEHGQECEVAYALSMRQDPEDAVCDLRCREGTVLRNIGCYVVHDSDRTRWADAHPDAQDEIAEWAERREMEVVVWTALKPNFGERREEKFSIGSAKRYLQSRDGAAKRAAIDYIQQAPLGSGLLYAKD